MGGRPHEFVPPPRRVVDALPAELAKWAVRGTQGPERGAVGSRQGVLAIDLAGEAVSSPYRVSATPQRTILQFDLAAEQGPVQRAKHLLDGWIKLQGDVDQMLDELGDSDISFLDDE
jgi:hypothetical protein